VGIVGYGFLEKIDILAFSRLPVKCIVQGFSDTPSFQNSMSTLYIKYATSPLKTSP
jgi:hypothetical protein